MDKSLDPAKVLVRLQAVLTLREVSVAELEQYQAGTEIVVDLARNGEVAIVINGRMLGKGRLTPAPGDTIGVQIVGWDV